MVCASVGAGLDGLGAKAAIGGQADKVIALDESTPRPRST